MIRRTNMKKSASRADIVEKSRPDIVEQLNKEARERREVEKLQEEKDKNEEKIRQEKIEREQDSMMIITSIKKISGFSSGIPVMTIMLYVLEYDQYKNFQ